MTIPTPGVRVVQVLRDSVPSAPFSKEDLEALHSCGNITEEVAVFLPLVQRCLLEASAPFSYSQVTLELKVQVAVRLTAALRQAVLHTRHLQYMEISWAILPSDIQCTVDAYNTTTLEVSLGRMLMEIERVAGIRTAVASKTKHFNKRPSLLGALLFRPAPLGIDEIINSREWFPHYELDEEIIRRMCRVRSARMAVVSPDRRWSYGYSTSAEYHDTRQKHRETFAHGCITDSHWIIWAHDMQKYPQSGDKNDDHDYK